MSPGEQFERINNYQTWERKVAGVPDETDLKVRHNAIVKYYAW